MVTFSDLKGRKEYKLCVKTQRRCARHKQVKTLRRHLKSYITLCNITSCNIMEKWKNRPATVCALHDKVCNYITSCNIMEKWKIDSRQFARTGHSITHALPFVLEAIYEAVACADLGARVFFADLSKGFDLVD